ncbi:MAG: M4 family metallopeptidase [Chitinophagales bacterium]
MKNKCYISWIFLGLMLFVFALEQETLAKTVTQRHKIIKKGQVWHIFEQENEVIDLETFLTSPPKKTLKLETNDNLKFLKKQKDNLGCEHAVFQQYYKDVVVEAAILKVHECQKQALKANGNLAINLELNTAANVSETEALNFALRNIDAEKYAWQNEAFEKQVRETKKDNEATFYPKGNLVVLSDQLFPMLGTSHLAYKFEIYAEKPLKYKSVYIDAHTGDFLLDFDLLHNYEIELSGAAQYSCEEAVFFTADYDEYNEAYCLKNDNTIIYDAQNADNSSDMYICNDNVLFEDSAAVAILWASEQSLAYFKTEHNHENIGETGQALTHWLHYEEGFNNAFWNGNWFVYGDGDGINYDAFVSLDIVAHEMTHALIDHTANLIYAYEAGALNESFSDIFAILIQHFAEPTCADWIIGEDIVKQAGKNGLRNLANPKDETMINRQPNTYKGEFWHYEATDNGGVHTNSGVLSFWFYLLVEGGSGINDLQNAYVVDSVGWETAAAIVYQTLTSYLTPTSQYLDARNATIEATIDLFGEASEELTAVLDAWKAVGLAADMTSDKSLTFTNFNNNISLAANSFVDITWQTTGFINNVTLELSTDNGNIWYSIAQNVSNTGLFAWQVPNVATDLARLRISDNTDINIFDLSDASFQIETCPVISSFLPNNNIICQGEMVSFTNVSANAHTFRWLLNNIEISQSQDFTYTFPESGSYEIKLKAKDTIRNCVNSYTELIEIEANIESQFTYTIDGLELDAFISSDTLNAISYDWQFENSFFENVPTFTYVFDNAGIYDLCLNVQSSCNASTICQNITVLTPAICEGDETWRYYISGKQINDMAEANEDFWIASDGGLSVLHKIDWSVNTYTSFSSGLTDNQVNTVAVAPNNAKWVGTQNGGLLEFKNGSWDSYTTENSSLPSQTVYDIKIDADGAKWVATSNGLLRINGGIWRVFNNSNSFLPSNSIRCLEIKANGDMWIGTDNGLCFYDKESKSHIIYTNEDSDLQSNDIQTLAIDNQNIVWIAYKEGGLDSIEEDIVTNHNDNLPNENVQDIIVDAENVKWIATKNGLVQFDNESWTVFDSENSDFNDNTINALMLANNGSKWIGTANGAYRYMEETWQYFEPTTAVLPHNETTDIAIDNNQNIWVTTVAGLVKYNQDEWRIYNQETESNTASRQHFTSIAIDENNVKWIGSFDEGLFRLENEVMENFSVENSDLTNNKIYQVEAEGTDIWLTQNDKLVRFDGISFSNFDFEMAVEPTALVIDSVNHHIWIGTENSGIMLCEYLNSTSCYTINNALLVDNQIISLLIHDSKLLAATQNGLIVYENGMWNNFANDNNLFNNDVIHLLAKDAQERLITISNNHIYLQKNDSWKAYDIPQRVSFCQNLSAVIDENLNVWLATNQGVSTQFRSDEATAFFETSSIENCENYTVECINKSVGTNSYKWLINGAFMSEDGDFIHEFEAAGTYKISLIATNDSDCEDVFSQEIKIYSNANNVYLPEQIAVCIEDENPIIEANAKDMISYEWRRNGELLSTEYFCEATQQGNYELYITDNCGNDKSLETHIYIDNDCVWPGDLNHDKIVNHYDLLALALSIGQAGQKRPDATTNWQGQPSFDWGVIAANMSDLKHIDANGNGIIDLDDIQIVDFHYGKTHNNQSINIPPDLSSDIDFRATLFSPPTATNNKTMEVDLKVIHKQSVPIHAYGIAFDIEYALPAGLNMQNIELDFSTSWLNTSGSNVQTIYKHFPEMNKIEVVITRTDHQNTSSSGIIAKLRAEVDVVPSGTSALMILNINNVLFINNEGLPIPIATSQNTLNILPEDENGKYELPTDFEPITIYPNPTNNAVTLSFSDIMLDEKTNIEAKLYDMQGKQFVPRLIAQSRNEMQLNVADIPIGVYQFILSNEKERLHTSKLMIYR